MMIRNLTVAGSYNVRDLGGYPTSDGHMTRWRVFVRAGDVSKLGVEGCAQVTDYGIQTVVDLRDESEAANSPNSWAPAHVNYLHLPLIGDHLSQDAAWREAHERYTYLHELYASYLDQCQTQIASIIGAMAESNPATLFHCFAGKDRTGMITALLLGVVGVPDEVIVDDYALTSQFISEQVAEWRERAARYGDDMVSFERDVASAPETMTETLAILRERYGGFRAYLRDSGVTTEQLRVIRERFVEG